MISVRDMGRQLFSKFTDILKLYYNAVKTTRQTDRHEEDGVFKFSSKMGASHIPESSWYNTGYNTARAEYN